MELIVNDLQAFEEKFLFEANKKTKILWSQFPRLLIAREFMETCVNESRTSVNFGGN